MPYSALTLNDLIKRAKDFYYLSVSYINYYLLPFLTGLRFINYLLSFALEFLD